MSAVEEACSALNDAAQAKALGVIPAPDRMMSAIRALIAEHEHLQAAYSEVKGEYADYRLDRQDQMARLRSAIEDAERGSRTGNLMTPPWVAQSIRDIRAAWEKVTR
jgi:hypothetical protein